ncbi:MAG: efflux RND transporter permease subunit [Pseudomonadales bacterium]|nr:efflux RND transporter permease subunit [Pseudomonadales bacterium]
MINRIIGLSVEYRYWVVLLAIICSGAGYLALQKTPVDAIPDLSDVQVIVRTTWPGQSPSIVQDQVTFPLSSAMLSVPGARTVRGFSFFGDSFVYVLFGEGTDIYWARARVQEYLAQITARLPEGATSSLGPDATGVGWVYIYALEDRSGKHDISELRSLQDWFLKYELQSIEGVSEVATAGGMIRQFQVTVDPNRLKAFGLSLSDLSHAIRSGNSETGASVIEMAEAEYMVRVTGYIQTEDDLRTIPLGTDSRGTPILLKDLAEISTGPQMRRGVTDLNGEGEAVGGIIIMRHGENASTTIARVKDKLQTLRASLPEGVTIVPVYDRSVLIDGSIRNLAEKLTMELALVILVCAIFLLHLPSAIVTLITLPLGIVIAVMVMQLQGLNANIMSLGGIALAIGTMVDGTIVMIENLHRHQESGTDTPHWDKVLAAAREVGPSLFASLIIITISFIPVFALEAQEGKLFSPLAWTKTWSMAAAALLTITLVPVLAGFLIRKKPGKQQRVSFFDRYIVGFYQRLLGLALRAPALPLIATLAFTVWGLAQTKDLGREFMPPLDEGDLMYMPTTYAGISIGTAHQILQQTNKLIRTLPEVETVYGKAGRADTATDPAPLTMIETFIQLNPRSEWRPGMTTDTLIAELDALIQAPGLSNAWVMPVKTRIDMLSTGIKTPLGLRITGPDLSVIETLGRDIETILSAVPGTASVYAERVQGGRYITIDIDRAKAARYGLNVADIHLVLSTAVGGTNVSYTVEGLARYPINMRYPQNYRNSPEALRALPVVTASGIHLVLGDIADIRIDEGPAAIKSENARPTGTVFIDIHGSDLTGYVNKASELLAARLTLPPTYSVTWAGQFEYLQRAEARLTIIVPLTLLLITGILYLTFRRFTDVILILLTLPVALAGGLVTLAAMDFNLSVAVVVGLIALVGITAETGIIMLQYLKSAAMNQRNGALQSAVTEGAGRRLRPMLMTGIATIAGLVPATWGTGPGSDVMSRIAAPMVGGMIVTLLLTLIVLPVAWMLAERLRTGTQPEA